MLGTMKRQRGTGSLYMQPGSKVWSYQIVVNGKRERGTTGCRAKREAARALIAFVSVRSGPRLSSPWRSAHALKSQSVPRLAGMVNLAKIHVRNTHEEER
jgi:hypothetical protein